MNIAFVLKGFIEYYFKIKCILYLNPITMFHKKLFIKQVNWFIVFYGKKDDNILRYELPLNRTILIQTEQLNTTNRINNSLVISKNLIYNCRFILDYEEYNLKKYPIKMKYKIKYIPLPVIKRQPLNISSVKNKRKRILFFGSRSIRREKILRYLRNKNFDCLNITSVYGNDLINLIKNSSIVLNLHYEDESLLEIIRLKECISFEIKILSELPSLLVKNNIVINNPSVEDMDIDLANRINFIPIIKKDLSNIEVLINGINKILCKKVDIEKIDTYIEKNNKECIKRWRELLKMVKII